VAVPDFQTIMRPVLVILADDEDHTVTQIRAHLAQVNGWNGAQVQAYLVGETDESFRRREALGPWVYDFSAFSGE
jgi:restriction endonuclease Mrr